MLQLFQHRMTFVLQCCTEYSSFEQESVLLKLLSLDVYVWIRKYLSHTDWKPSRPRRMLKDTALLLNHTASQIPVCICVCMSDSCWSAEASFWRPAADWI